MDSQKGRISIMESWRNNPPEIDFCLANFIAGTVGVVAVPAGIGKTSLLMQLGAGVAAGIPVAGALLPPPPKTGKVVFFATEDPPSVLKRRAHFFAKSLLAQGHGPETIAAMDRNFEFVSLPSPPKLLSNDHIGSDGMHMLEVAAKDSRLLILDPIRRFHYCDEHDFDKMLLLFEMLSSIVSGSSCSLLFSHHVEQALHTRDLGELEGAQGSSAFINATRWVVNMNGMSLSEADHFGMSPELRRSYVRVAFTKSNYGAPIPARWLKRSTQFEGVFETCELEAKVAQ